MIEALAASSLVAALSLTGVFLFKEKGYVTGTHRFILPFAVGVFLAVIFFELIPETFSTAPVGGPIALLVGFLGFYIFSFFMDTFHHHHFTHEDRCASGGAYKLLIGDSIHNFSDGVIVATAFMINPAVGIATAIGVALHEIPQEIAEFGVLLHSGCTRKKAVLYNTLSATTIILGALVTLLLGEYIAEYLYILTGIVAGNLLYIATTDLIPELRDTHREHFSMTFGMTLLGVIIVGTLVHYTHAFLG
ncbi:MAG TPA: ZIP family metal transporter [Candidatus Paceibacterota bacterium]|nr:ZIP family metal transporter [Candidatus Paceibacterota bacterium]